MINLFLNTGIFLVVIYALMCVSALVYNRELKKNGYTGIPWKECFTIKKHMSFFIGWILGIIPQHILIQYSIRFLSKRCMTCQTTGVCFNEYTGNKTCGCDPYKMACSPFESCKNGKYGPIIFNKREAWEYIDKVKPFVAYHNNN